MVKKRKRKSKLIYRCKSCSKHSTFDFGRPDITLEEILIRHLEGTSIRKLSDQLNASKSDIDRKVRSGLQKVPNSNHISEIICNDFHYGYLLVDGKYVHVKGHKNKVALIWAVDNYSHDILAYVVAPSENYQAYLALFKILKKMNYPLWVLTCDDHASIVPAMKAIYPKARVQLCLNHYKESVRRRLKSRSNPVHTQFVRDIEGLFKAKSKRNWTYRAKRMIYRYPEEIHQSILVDLSARYPLLTTYYDFPCPATTNLVEAFNSHLEDRIKGIRGFESMSSFEIWINAYIMNRRLTKFKSCTKKYTYLNGKVSLYFTAGHNSAKVKLLKKVR